MNFFRIPLLLFAVLVPLGAAYAQERFFTQTGARGLQNARMEAQHTALKARVTTNEGDISSLQTRVGNIETACNEEEKLRWNGAAWVCTTEQDPTVQAWAKESVSDCTAGQVLTLTSGSLSCVADQEGVTDEVDPTVQDFAKEVVNNCTAAQVLTMSGGSLSCKTDDQGVSTEVDPTVESFAKVGLPTCASNEVLTGDGTNLSCKFDVGGSGAALNIGDLNDVTISTPSSTQVLSYNGVNWVNANETDPNVETFAKTTLPTCGADEVLDGDGSSLSCTDVTTIIGNSVALSGLSDVTISSPADNQVLSYDNGTGEWINAAETDPNVETFAKTTLPTCGANEVLTGDGSALTCVTASSIADGITLSGLSDVVISAPSSNQVLAYDGSDWVNAAETDPNVQDFAKEVVANCTASEVITMTAGSLGCTDAATAVGSNYNLNDMGDVNLGVLADAEVLKYDNASGKWVNAVEDDPEVGTLTASRFCQVNGAGDTIDCANTAATQRTQLGVGTGDSVVFAGVEATGQVSASSARVANDLTVLGNLNVSGTQQIDGVVFANGGVSATGVISATSFSGDGSNLSGVTAADVAWGGVTGKPTSLTDLIGIATDDSVIAVGDGSTWVGESGATARTSLGVGTSDDVVFNSVEVSGNVSGTSLNVSGTSYVDALVNTGASTLEGNATVGGTLGVTGAATLDSTLGVTGLTTLGNVSTTLITMTGEPTEADHVVTKSYVDVQLSGKSAISAGDSSVTVADLGSGQINLSVDNEDIVTITNNGTVFEKGYVRAQDGTDIVPVWSFEADTDTGLYRSGVDQLTFVTGAASRVTIDSAGDVDIGGGLTASGGLTGTLQTAAQPSVTSVGSLSDLGVSGNITATNVLATGYVSTTQVNVSGTVHADDVNIASGEIDGTAIGANSTSTGAFTTLDASGLSSLAGVSATGNISANKFIGDGSDLSGVTASSADWYDLTSIPTGVQNISTTELTTGELGELQNIDSTTITGTQWGYLGAADQAIATTDDVTFNTVESSGQVSASSARIANDLTVLGNLNVSGTQQIDGVVFANGGLNATGTVSATSFSGDGSALTNVTADEVVAASSTGALQFNVGNRLAGDATNLFWDDSNNRLGVGTGTPGTELEVAGHLTMDDGANPANIYFNQQNGQWNLVRWMLSDTDKFDMGYVTSGSPDRFFLRDFADSSHEFLVKVEGGSLYFMQDGGNVGIGDTTPQYTLDVSGTVQATNALRVGPGSTNAVMRSFISGTDGALLGNPSGAGTPFTGTFLRVGAFQADGSNDTLNGRTDPVMIIRNETSSVSDYDGLSIEEYRLNFSRGAAIGISATASTTGTYEQQGIDINYSTNDDNVKGLAVNVSSASGTPWSIYASAGDVYVADNIGIGTDTPSVELDIVGGVSATGNISANKFIGDGSDLTGVTASSADWYDLTSIPTGVQNISTTELTTGELGELQNIDSTTITGTQWGYLGAADQAIATTDDVTFNTVESSGQVSASSARIANDLTVLGNLNVSGTQQIDGVVFANGGLDATGNISATTFTGDGSGLTGVTASSADWYDLTSIPTGVQNISTTELTTGELGELQNIDSTTITGTQWGYLGAMDQGVATTDGVQFGDITLADATPRLIMQDTSNTIAQDTLQNFIEYRGASNSVAAQVGFLSNASKNFEVRNVLAGDILFRTNSIVSLYLSSEGNVGIGNSNPQHSLIISGDEPTSAAHLAIGEVAIANSPSAEILFIGTTKQNAGLMWNPGSGAGDGMFELGYGGGSDPAEMTRFFAAYADGDVSATGILTIAGVDSSADITTTGNVDAATFTGDGSGLTNVTASSADWYDLTSIPTGVQNISTTELTTGELGELQNIDSTTITGTQWGYLGAADQAIATTDDVTFNTVESSGQVSASSARIANDLTVLGNLNVSGTQQIDGVVFANGGLDATGTVSATSFSGDGSALTNVTADEVVAASSTGALQFNVGDRLAGDATNLFWDDSNNRLGVGTNSPSETLHVYDGKLVIDKTYYKSGLTVRHGGTTSGGDMAISVEQDSGSNGHAGMFVARGQADGWGGSFYGTKDVAPSSSTPEWFSGIAGRDAGSGYLYRIAEGTAGTSALASGNQLTLETRFAIEPGGNIGIGTSSPSDTLHVAGTGLFRNQSDSTSAFEVQDASGDTVLAVDTNSQTLVVGSGGLKIERSQGDGIFQTIKVNSGSQIVLSNELKLGPTSMIRGSGTNASYYSMGTYGHTIGSMVVSNGSGSLFSFDPASAWTPNLPNYTKKMLDFPGEMNSSAVGTLIGLHTDLTDNSSSVANTIIGLNVDVSQGTNASANRYAAIMQGGSVGIGTDSPSATLHVAGDVSATGNISANQFIGDGGGLTNVTADAVTAASGTGAIQFNVGNGLAGDTANLFWDDSNNRLGIGTNSPGATLDIAGGSINLDSGQAIFVAGSGGTLRVGDNGDNVNIANDTIYAEQDGGKVGVGTTSPSNTLHVIGDSDTIATFQGSNGGLVNIERAGASTKLTLGVSSANNAQVTTDSGLLTLNNSSGEVIRMNSSGNVGVGGVTTPSATLHVAGDISATGNISANKFIGDGSELTGIATDPAQIDDDDDDTFVSANATDTISLTTNGTTRMTVTSGGNIGVNTTTPATGATLDVSGTVKVSSSGSETCDNDHLGMIRYNSSTGKLQICRP